jgi:hypothetical protein
MPENRTEERIEKHKGNVTRSYKHIAYYKRLIYYTGRTPRSQTRYQKVKRGEKS